MQALQTAYPQQRGQGFGTSPLTLPRSHRVLGADDKASGGVWAPAVCVPGCEARPHRLWRLRGNGTGKNTPTKGEVPGRIHFRFGQVLLEDHLQKKGGTLLQASWWVSQCQSKKKREDSSHFASLKRCSWRKTRTTHDGSVSSSKCEIARTD